MSRNKSTITKELSELKQIKQQIHAVIKGAKNRYTLYERGIKRSKKAGSSDLILTNKQIKKVGHPFWVEKQKVKSTPKKQDTLYAWRIKAFRAFICCFTDYKLKISYSPILDRQIKFNCYISRIMLFKL